LRLHVATVDTDRARAQFHAVQNEVIRFCAASRRVIRQFVEILIEHGSKWMVRRVPAILFGIPLEHREIRNPQELEPPGIEPG